MIISDKQIMQLMDIAHHYIELISLIQMDGIQMNYPNEHKNGAQNLLCIIRKQQPNELKDIK